MRSLAWLAKNASSFLPGASGIPSEATLTALAETSLAVMQLTKPAVAFSEKQVVHRLAAAAQKSFAEPKVLDFYRSGPAAAAIGLLVTWLGLKGRGAEHVLTRDTLAAFIHDRRIDETGFTPLRTLELCWALDNIGIRHRLPQLHVLLTAGLRDALVIRHPAEMPEAEIYTFTHIVFFGTDYGRDLSFLAKSGLLKATQANTLALLEEMKNRKHWDLTAELLLVWCCLGGSEHSGVDRAWRALFAAQTADGSFPAGDEKPIRDETDPGRSRALRRYHVCLVAALAAFAPCGRTEQALKP